MSCLSCFAQIGDKSLQLPHAEPARRVFPRCLKSPEEVAAKGFPAWVIGRIRPFGQLCPDGRIAIEQGGHLGGFYNTHELDCRTAAQLEPHLASLNIDASALEELCRGRLSGKTARLTIPSGVRADGASKSETGQQAFPAPQQKLHPCSSFSRASLWNLPVRQCADRISSTWSRGRGGAKTLQACTHHVSSLLAKAISVVTGSSSDTRCSPTFVLALSTFGASLGLLNFSDPI